MQPLKLSRLPLLNVSRNNVVSLFGRSRSLLISFKMMFWVGRVEMKRAHGQACLCCNLTNSIPWKISYYASTNVLIGFAEMATEALY